MTATAGGLVFTALQDGWVVAYNDETLEELWRFNVGTPLKGAPVTYAIGPKQYLAVQTERPPPASGELGQAGELELPVRVRAELRNSSTDPELFVPERLGRIDPRRATSRQVRGEGGDREHCDRDQREGDEIGTTVATWAARKDGR